MTIEDLKKLDKRLRQIQDPFNTGYPTLWKVIEETAEKNGLPASGIFGQYIAWKMKK